MEEELANQTTNSTYLEDFEQFDLAFHYYLFLYTFSIILFISLVSDFFIMLLITRTTRMKRRTYIIFLNWLFWETLNLLSTHSMHGLIVDITYLFDSHHAVYCIVSGLEPWCQLISFLLMFILITDTIMKSKKLTIKFIMITFYTILTVLVLIKCCLCLNGSRLPFLALVTALTLIILILDVFIKDVVRFCKYRRNRVKTTTNFRTNVVRIYTYNWVITVLLILSSIIWTNNYYVHRLLYIIVFLNPLYIFIYLLLSDEIYKVHFMKLIKCDFKYDHVNATVSFDGDCDDNTDGAVNIILPGCNT